MNNICPEGLGLSREFGNFLIAKNCVSHLIHVHLINSIFLLSSIFSSYHTACHFCYYLVLFSLCCFFFSQPTAKTEQFCFLYISELEFNQNVVVPVSGGHEGWPHDKGGWMNRVSLSLVIIHVSVKSILPLLHVSPHNFLCPSRIDQTHLTLCVYPSTGSTTSRTSVCTTPAISTTSTVVWRRSFGPCATRVVPSSRRLYGTRTQRRCNRAKYARVFSRQ